MVILASASPRRLKLTKEEITSSFIVIKPDIDESLSFKKYDNVIDIVKDIAYRKCISIAEDHPHDLVIAADTVVVINDQIIGKPKDENDAYHMLKMLSNNEHYVYTGYALKKDNTLVVNYVKSDVIFNELSDELINDYIKSGSPMDKAGAYGYQDNNSFPLVKKINGSVTNVIGFPVDEIKADLNKYHLL